MPSDQGIYSVYVPPVTIPRGWDIAPFQPPHPPQPDGRFGGLVKGDEGIYAPFVRFFPYGWEVAPVQPRHPRPEAAGAFMPSEAGIEAQYVFVPSATFLDAPFTHLRYRGSNRAGLKGSNQFPIWSTWINYGWDIPSFQPPHPRPERAGAIATSEPGVEAKFVATQVVWGWEVQPFQPSAVQYRLKTGAFKVLGSIETPPFVFQPSGWEVQPFQPPHPRVEKSGAIMPSETGIESKFVFTPTIWGWDIAAPFVKYQRRVNPEIGDQGTQSSLINFIPYNWIIPPPQPPHPRPERAGAIMPWEQGIESQYVFVPPFKWGWEVSAPHLRKQTSTRYFGIEGTSDFATFDFLPYGWELPPFQPPHPRPERGASVVTSEPGIEARFIPAAFVTNAWEIAPPFVRYRRFNDPDIGDQGTQFPLIRFFPYGWELPPFQPRHPRPERSGAIMPWEPGIEAVFVPPAFVTDAWEVQSWQPPHPRPERWGAIARGDDGTQFPLIRWFNSGWEITPFQPPHPRPEKAAAIMPWEAGIEARYIFIAPPTIAWEVASFQPRHPTPERRAAAIFKGDDGIEFPFLRWFNAGWEVAPFQPSHPRVEKFGAVVRGDEGIQARFIRWFNMGWEIPPYQPPHPRRERVGAIMPWESGIEAPYVFVPPPILARLDPNYITYPQSRVTVTAGAARLLEVSYPQQRITLTAIGPRKVKIVVFTLDQSQLDGDDVLG